MTQAAANWARSGASSAGSSSFTRSGGARKSTAVTGGTRSMRGRRLEELGNPPEVLRALDARAEPDVRGVHQIRREHLANQVGPLGEQLPVEHRRLANHRPKLLTPLVRDLRVEHVRQRGAED